MAVPFNVMATYWLSRDRLYRVYSDANALHFVRIGGQFAYKDLRKNPPVGGLAYAVQSTLAARERIMSPADIAALDQKPPGEITGQHEHDLTIPLAEIDSSNLKPPPKIGLNGRHFGQWLLLLRNGERFTFQFMEIEQMRVALSVLPKLLQGHVQVEVRWDAGREKFVATC